MNNIKINLLSKIKNKLKLDSPTGVKLQRIGYNVQVAHNGKQYYVGYFRLYEDAAKASIEFKVDLFNKLYGDLQKEVGSFNEL